MTVLSPFLSAPKGAIIATPTQTTFSNHAFNFWVHRDFGNSFSMTAHHFPRTNCLIGIIFHKSANLDFVDVSNVIRSNVSHSLWNSCVKAIDPFDFSLTVYLPLIRCTSSVLSNLAYYDELPISFFTCTRHPRLQG